MVSWGPFTRSSTASAGTRAPDVRATLGVRTGARRPARPVCGRVEALWTTRVRFTDATTGLGAAHARSPRCRTDRADAPARLDGRAGVGRRRRPRRTPGRELA